MGIVVVVRDSTLYGGWSKLRERLLFDAVRSCREGPATVPEGSKAEAIQQLAQRRLHARRGRHVTLGKVVSSRCRWKLA